MTNEVLFFTQIASIVAFIAALFVLYRLLVSQKDATIGLLKEKNEFLSVRLAEAKECSPDVLVENLSKRVKITSEEIERLNNDRDANQQLIEEKESELHILQSQLTQLETQVASAQDILKDFLCPHCGAPMETKEQVYGYVGGREIDADAECVTYECGLTIKDGREERPCENLYS